MALQISRTDIKLNIETTKSYMDIRSSHAKLFLLHEQEKLDIHTELPRVVIDQYECFATSGLMGPVNLTREAAQRAMQQALAYTSKVAADGDAMAAIENKQNPLPEIAWRDGYTLHEFEIDYIPKARPKITVVGGDIKITPRYNASGAANGVKGEIVPGDIKINYIPARVKISVAQYASVRFNYARDGFNAYA